MFKNEISNIAENLQENAKLALISLRSDKKWKEHWDSFIKNMVYQLHKPTFEQAVEVLVKLSEAVQ